MTQTIEAKVVEVQKQCPHCCGRKGQDCSSCHGWGWITVKQD